MTLLLAMRSLLSRPVRTAVLAGGFGLGVAVMAALLGVAAVILEQAQTPALVGGGDVVIDGQTGRLANPRFALAAVGDDLRVVAAVPIERATLYLVDNAGVTPIRARGGIPSLERAMRDPETVSVTPWVDASSDRAWAMPDWDEVLREMDRFHPIPDVPAYADSWAEWLYFNGRSETHGFYLTFLSGPRLPSGRRQVLVRLQLQRQDGSSVTYSDSGEVDEADLLATAPNVSVGRNTVRLAGHDYRIAVDLASESGASRATGELVLHAKRGRALPPLVLRGAGGWISGYVVPAMAGAWHGSLDVDRRPITFDGAAGYHDHNWGFWNGVTWQWGQVQGDGLSFVYGRVRPPAAVADRSRVPAFLMALGADGPLGYSTNVTIAETDRADGTAPERILVSGQSDALSVNIDLAIEQATRSRFGPAATPLRFLQMRAHAHVSGTVGGTPFDFRAPASAETFRGQE
jgi:hypothetical protein